MQTSSRILGSLGSASLTLCAASFATAQTLSFNIDVGSGPTPSATYGAAAGQPGFWMSVAPGTANTAIPLTSIYGSTTAATLSYTSGYDFTFNNAQTSGDDEALLDDTQGAFSNSHWTFANLRPGDYDIWSYAWAPDSPMFFKTRVVVTGSLDPAQVVGGAAWNGTFVLGGHYAKHRVTVGAGGTMEIVFSVAVSACTANGVQIRELAPPPEIYCTAGTSTHGCLASVSSVGTPSASATTGFTITASNVEGQRSGLVFFGMSGRTAAPWGSGSSFMCVGAPTQRTAANNSGGTNAACDGTLAVDWNDYMATHPSALGNPRSAGQTFQAQAWYRDPTAPKTSQLSNAIDFMLSP